MMDKLKLAIVKYNIQLLDLFKKVSDDDYDYYMMVSMTNHQIIHWMRLNWERC